MKKMLLTIYSLIFAIGATFAQSAEGCDGTRYLAGEVFNDVSVTTVSYGENTDFLDNVKNLEMDIYQPMGDAVTKRPVIVLAHGGSFVGGERGDMETFATAYAKMGYVAVSITYRLFPLFEVGALPNQDQMIDTVVKAVGDMKAAIRYLRMDAAAANTYNIDTDYILVGGLSAGAIAAMHVAQLDTDDMVPDYVQLAVDNNGGLEGTTGNDGYDSTPLAVVSMSGGLHDQDWLDADDIPFISMHGDNDQIVPYLGGLAANVVYIDGSGNIHPAADAVGVANYLTTVPAGGHTNIYNPTLDVFVPFQVDFAVNGNIFLHTILCPNTPVSVATPEVDAQVSVYPNPTSEVATIDLGNIEANYDLVIYDQVGKVVHTDYNRTSNTVVLNKVDFGAGLFVAEIRVMEDGVQSVMRKVVFN